jgi:hypothetical protein
MVSNRKTAIIVGVLFIIAMLAGVLSLVFLGPQNDPDYLINVSANENQIIIGALLTLIMAFAVAMIPVMMFPIFKKHNEALALGYVVFRVLEAVTYFVAVISPLLLITLSQGYVKAGTPDTSYFQAIGTSLLANYDYWAGPINTIVFCLGALMFYSLLYQSKLIPRFISVWGLIGTIMHLVEGFLVMFGLLSPFSTLEFILALPVAVNEMFLAIWLIGKGFNPSAIASGSAKKNII